MALWCLPASSGRDRLTGEFRDIYKGPDGQAVLCAAILISGEFWKSAPYRKTSDLVENYAVSLPQVLMDWQTVDELIFQLGEWLDKPKTIQIDLTPEKIKKDQTFSIKFEKSDQLRTLDDKTHCTITYSGIVFNQGVWSFVVDQSCIRNFHNELRAAFSATDAQSFK